MPCQTTQQNFTFFGLVAAILNWGHTHYNRSYMNPIQVYTAYNLYTVTPQPEGPKNTLTNCICTPCFYITNWLNIVIHFFSMPAMRRKHKRRKDVSLNTFGSTLQTSSHNVAIKDTVRLAPESLVKNATFKIMTMAWIL